MSALKIHTLAAPFPDVPHDSTSLFPAAAHLSLRLKTFRYLLRQHSGLNAGAKVVDLGAGPGNFSRVAARLGFNVTAVDARMPWTLGDALRARSDADDHASGTAAPTREFRRVQCDLRHFAELSTYDMVLAVGVIYHLPLSDQLDLFRRCEGRPVLIDTELFAAECLPPHHAHRFQPIVTEEGYEGALCHETGNIWSSNGDARSFWFSHDSLLRAFEACGRRAVTVIDPPYHSAFGPRRWYLLHV